MLITSNITSNLDQQSIKTAFQIIINHTNSKQLIKQADTYLHQCQNNTNFAITLMKIFSQTNNQQTQWQVLIHLNTVIKRNWTTNRRVNQVCFINQDMKDNIKNGLVSLYQIHWRAYYKQFNQTFKFLARYEFPSNYPTLQKFMREILMTLANSDIQVLITPPQLLPYLSLVKVVFKQNSFRRFIHSKQNYVQHIAQPMKLSFVIFSKVNSALNGIKNMRKQDVQYKAVSRLLQCSRKIDKIILYCLQSMTGGMQCDPQICRTVQLMLSKLELLLSIDIFQLTQQIQLNILAILQGVSKIQEGFPFVFTNFLQRYLYLILQLLINNNFHNEKLIKCILSSNSKPLTIFPYYANQSQIDQINQSRRVNGPTYTKQQIKCHQQFFNIYGGNKSIIFMEKAISELMNKYKKDHFQEENIFDDSQHYQVTSQYTVFERLLLLLKVLMIRFKQQFKGFSTQILSYLLQNKITSNASDLAMNMYEIVLLMSKVYDQGNLNIQKIFQLIQLTYTKGDFTTFSRLIRNYTYYFSISMACKSFQFLINIIASININHQIKYQCALGIKKILAQHNQEELPLQNIGLCLENLLSLVIIYKKVPSHLWSLLKLVNQILKLVNNQVVMNNLNCVIDSTQVLIELKDNDEIIISAISDLLQNVLQLTSPEQSNDQKMVQYLYETSIKLVGMYICNDKLLNPQTLYRLWLSVVRSVQVPKCSFDLTQKLVNIFHNFQDKLMHYDLVLFLQLTQQYIIKTLLKITPQQMISLTQKVLTQLTSQNRKIILMVLFSTYFSFFITTGIYIEKIIILAISIIKQLYNQISQENNILRTFIIVVINHHVIQLGPRVVFQIFNQHANQEYQTWFWPYIWSFQSLGHKYACKVTSIAILASLQILHQAKILLPEIQNCVPLQKLMRIASLQVQPISISNSINSSMNAYNMITQPQQKKDRLRRLTPLKYKIQIKKDWVQYDLSIMYREKFISVISSLGWTLEIIIHKFNHQKSNKIIKLLTGQRVCNDIQ